MRPSTSSTPRRPRWCSRRTRWIRKPTTRRPTPRKRTPSPTTLERRMSPRKRCIATNVLLLAASLFLASAAIAAPAGTIVQATGPVFTQASDGRIKALSADSAVGSGDTLVTGRETFAQVRFTDGCMATLGPDTRLAIDAGGPSRVTLQLGTLQVIGAPGIAQRHIHTPGGVIRPCSA